MLPKGITGFYDRTQSPPPIWMKPAQLGQDWHDCVRELGEAEIAQIRDWNPRTVGEILFNFWD